MKSIQPEEETLFTSGVEDFEAHTAEALAEATRRYEALKPFVRVRSKNNALEEAAKTLGLSRTRAYKLLGALKRDDRPAALLFAKRGRKPGIVPLAPRKEAILQAVLDEMLSRPEEHTFAMIYEAVRIACHKEKLKPPGEKYIRKRIAAIPAIERGAMKYGSRVANQLLGPKMGAYLVEAPLDQFQIDHTKLDIIIVDSTTGMEIGRPWLTVVIDVFSRAIMAFHLSLEAPSSKTLGLVLTMAVWPKKSFLESRDLLDIEWPMYGIPKEIFVDNGSDMRSVTFERGCMAHNIRLNFRREVHAGGIIERLVGTLVQRTHVLPGTTGSNTSARKNYDSQKHAHLSLWEMERWVAYDVQRYHNRIHRSLKVTPLQKWKEGTRESNIKPDRLGTGSERQFFISFLPSEHRRVRPEGVALFGERFVGDVLASLIGQTIEVRYNPSDHRTIYVRDKGGAVYTAANIDATNCMEPRSFAELRGARKARMLKMLSTSDGGAEIRALIQQDRIVRQSRKKRRAEESRRRHDAEHLPLREESRQRSVTGPVFGDIDFTSPFKLLETGK